MKVSVCKVQVKIDSEFNLIAEERREAKEVDKVTAKGPSVVCLFVCFVIPCGTTAINYPVNSNSSRLLTL